MKYLSLQSVQNAFEGNKNTTTTKFWTLMGILFTIEDQICPGISYSFNMNVTANYLDRIFAITDALPTAGNASLWYAKFGAQWVSELKSDLLSGNTPNIYDIAVWCFRKESFDDEITKEDLVSRFLSTFKLTRSEANYLFDFEDRDIVYVDVLYSDNELYQHLKNTYGDTSDNINVMPDGKFLKNNAGAVQSGGYIKPFFNTDYSNQCVLLTDYNTDSIFSTPQTITTGVNGGINKIYFGCPGGGKSHAIKQFLEDNAIPIEQQFRTTFHPDSDYSSFVGAYKPNVVESEITYEFVPQVFTNVYVEAWNNPTKQYFLIIEEINRGNCAQIFGDLFQLLDRKENGLSEYPIDADADLKKYLLKVLINQGGIAQGKLCLPANLTIFATMNTSDQSLFPMDSAFKRRWEWEFVPIEPSDLSRQFKITIGDRKYDWTLFLDNINSKIKDSTESEDKQMGSHFIKSNINEAQFKSKVMFYLWSEVFKMEYLTPKNHFRSKDLNSSEETEFSFNDLYKTGGTILLEGFMRYLQVNPDEE